MGVRSTSPLMPSSPSSKRVRIWSVPWTCTIPIQQLPWFLRFIYQINFLSTTGLTLALLRNRWKQPPPKNSRSNPARGAWNPAPRTRWPLRCCQVSNWAVCPRTSFSSWVWYWRKAKRPTLIYPSYGRSDIYLPLTFFYILVFYVRVGVIWWQ